MLCLSYFDTIHPFYLFRMFVPNTSYLTLIVGRFRALHTELHVWRQQKSRIPRMPRSVFPYLLQRFFAFEHIAGSVRRKTGRRPSISSIPCKSQTIKRCSDLSYTQWLKARTKSVSLTGPMARSIDATLRLSLFTKPLLLLNFVNLPWRYFSTNSPHFT